MAERARPHAMIGDSDEPLKDKVALLFNGANEDGRFMAVSLATYGADIAILCPESRAQHARETAKLVETQDRRCLVIVPSRTDNKSLSRDVIPLAIKTLGRLDIFIDCSSLRYCSVDGTEDLEDPLASAITDTETIPADLDRIAHRPAK